MTRSCRLSPASGRWTFSFLSHSADAVTRRGDENYNVMARLKAGVTIEQAARLLFGVSATDIVTFSTVPLILASIARLASSLPARRATQVDPVVALREE
jgi:ABC-type lipoprotein release transport system permease subunit